MGRSFCALKTTTASEFCEVEIGRMCFNNFVSFHLVILLDSDRRTPPMDEATNNIN